MRNTNEMELIFDSLSANEGFARVAVAAFMTQLNPTVEEVADVKTAISEAVTNAVIHGYENEIHKIFIRCNIKEETIYIEVEDHGKGIEDVKKRWSRYLQQSLKWIGREWDFRLWKLLWIIFVWNRCKEKELR